MKSRVLRALRLLTGIDTPPGREIGTIAQLADGRISVFDPEASFRWSVSGPEIQRHQEFFVSNVQNGHDQCQRFLRLYFGIEPSSPSRLQEAMTRFSFGLQVLRQLLPVSTGVWADVGSLGYDALLVATEWPDVTMNLMTYEGGIMTIDGGGFHYATSLDSAGPSVHMKKCDAEHDDFPVAAASVDVITAWETLEHFKFGPQKFISEASRVLKPGGLVFVTTPNSTSAAALVNIFNGQHPSECREYSRDLAYGRIHPLEYDYGQLRYLFQMNGFEIMSQTSMSFGTFSQDELNAMTAAHRFQADAGLAPAVHLGKKWVLIARKTADIDDVSLPANLFA